MSIGRAVDIADATGMIGLAILLRAAKAGRISLFVCQPQNAPTFKNWAQVSNGRPAVALIGDDGDLSHGAAAWKGYAYRMARWASSVLLHASGAKSAHYEAVIAAAERYGRVLVIETSTASAGSWLDVLAAIPPRPTLLIWPREGTHPIADDPSRAH